MYDYPWIYIGSDGFTVDTALFYINMTWPFIFGAVISYYAFRTLRKYIQTRKMIKEQQKWEAFHSAADDMEEEVWPSWQ